MSGKEPTSELSEQEGERRRDEVLKRMLNTPPKPHKPAKEARDDDAAAGRQQREGEKSSARRQS